MIRRSSIIALEITLALATALVIGLAVAWWRLSQGPVELGFIRQHVQAELSQARSGRPVGIDRVELAWSSRAGALELRAVDVRFEDGRGGVLSRAAEARIELRALPLLWGRISLVRAHFTGGDITLTRKPHGEVQLAFGPPGSPPDIIVPPPPLGETLAQRVGRLLDGLEETFRPVGRAGKLRSISGRDVSLAIIDEAGGGEWTAGAASFELARNGEALEFSAAARLEAARGGGLAPAHLRITTDTAFQTAIIEFGAEEVRPRALLSPAMLGPFAGLDAPLTADISIGLDRKTGITRLEGDAELGRGVAEMDGGQFRLDGGRLRGRYDIETDELIIDRITLAGARTGVSGEVRIRDASRIMRAAPGEPAALNIEVPRLTLEVPGAFSAPIEISQVIVRGEINSAERTITLDRLHARTGAAALEASGRVYWGEAGGEMRPGVALTGAVSGPIDAETVKRFWPIGLGEGARAQIEQGLLGGRATETTLKVDVTPQDIAAGVLRDASLEVRFNFSDASYRFIETMSPITAARGNAVLQGNRFDLNVAEARLNNLVVTEGRVELPQFKPKGAMAVFAARAEGEARNISELLLQEPLGLGERLPFHVNTATGRGVVNFRLQRPMLTEVPYAGLRFSIDGRIDNFAATMNTRRVALSNGRLAVRGDHRAIVVSGPIRAGTSDLNLNWTERMGAGQRGASSRYQISGVFDAQDLVRLGYAVAQYAEGRVGVTLTGEGAGFDVDNADVQVDLRNAAVDSPFSFYTKAAGQAASARFDVARGSDGSFSFNNLNARGAGGLVMLGALRVGRDGHIASADISRLALEGRSDARIVAERSADGVLDIEVSGPLFDAAPFMDFDEPEGEAAARAQAEPPVTAVVNVDRLKMQGDATLADARVRLAVARGALTYLIADGRAPGGGGFSLALGPRPADPQGRIAFRSEDAGFAMRALIGADNVVGGTASADGEWRAGPPSRAQFTVRLRDFQVVRLPAMARLLSSAGSLTGLVEMLNGDGIGFNSLDAPVAYAGGRLRISEARAAGPSLGLTASGAYDFGADNLDIDGVVVPSYGLNSMLGGVPILGDLLVSRRGEGIVGMTYSINGPVAGPRVGVNPLSALTPGIFRRIFEPITPRAQQGGGETAAAERAALPRNEAAAGGSRP